MHLDTIVHFLPSQILTLSTNLSRVGSLVDDILNRRGRDEPASVFLRRRQNGIRLLYFIASIVWDWGADAGQDALARKVGLVPPSSAVAVAAASTLERVALPAPGVVRFRYCFMNSNRLSRSSYSATQDGSSCVVRC
jgi:hypothetical protein